MLLVMKKKNAKMNNIPLACSLLAFSVPVPDETKATLSQKNQGVAKHQFR